MKGDRKELVRQNDRCKKGWGIEGFLESHEHLNMGGEISEDPPLPWRGSVLKPKVACHKIARPARKAPRASIKQSQSIEGAVPTFALTNFTVQ